jgi:hypothetical protein
MALLNVMAIDDQHGKVDWLKPSSAGIHATAAPISNC